MRYLKAAICLVTIFSTVSHSQKADARNSNSSKIIAIEKTAAFAQGSANENLQTDRQISSEAASPEFILESVTTGPKPKPVIIQDYNEIGCYYNIYKALETLSTRSDFNLNTAKVLYITDFDSFDVHAILEYQGYILDANNFKKHDAIFDIDKGLRINAFFERSTSYFARKASSPFSQVFVIPANDYLQKFSELGPRKDPLEITTEPATKVRSLYPAQSLTSLLRGFPDLK